MNENPKHILICGGTSGVGKATAILFANEGHHVFIFGRGEKMLHDVFRDVRHRGGIIEGCNADVSQYGRVEYAFHKAVSTFGPIDAVILCAAVPANNIFNTPVEQWEKIIGINLLGYAYCSKLAVEAMQGRGGRIVAIGSLCIRVLDNGCDLYVAAKTGVHGLMASLRKEIAGENISVTLINPGQIASGMVKETEDQKAQAVAEGRMLRPEDVARMIAFCVEQPPTVAITELEVVPSQQLAL